jgi:hypothetical protein
VLLAIHHALLPITPERRAATARGCYGGPNQRARMKSDEADAPPIDSIL